MPAALASDSSESPQRGPVEDGDLKRLFQTQFFHPDALAHFVMRAQAEGVLAGTRQVALIWRASGSGTSAPLSFDMWIHELKSNDMLNETLFARLEHRRPRSAGEIWRVAQQSLLGRRELYQGQTYAPRLSGGVDAAQALFKRLEAQRQEVRHGPLYLVGDRRSGLSWFMVEFTARYRHELQFAGLVEGVARRESSNSDEFEHQHVSVQLVSLLTLWLHGDAAGPGDGTVPGLLDRLQSLDDARGLIVVEDIRSANALQSLFERLPPAISVVCVCARGVTLPRGGARGCRFTSVGRDHQEVGPGSGRAQPRGAPAALLPTRDPVGVAPGSEALL